MHTKDKNVEIILVYSLDIVIQQRLSFYFVQKDCPRIGVNKKFPSMSSISTRQFEDFILEKEKERRNRR